MPGSPSPIDILIEDGERVEKPEFRSFLKSRAVLLLADADEVRSTDLTGQLTIQLKSTGRTYKLNSGNTTDADDGEELIRDANNLAFELNEIDGNDGEDGEDGQDGSKIFVQASAPSTSVPPGSIWIDSDSPDLDLYEIANSPPSWVDTGRNLKGADGAGAVASVNGQSGTVILDSDDITYADFSPTESVGDALDNLYTSIGMLAKKGANTDITSLQGINDASAAASGKIGEYITANVAFGSAVSLSSTTSKTITSISLSPGDWDVFGAAGFNGSSASSISLVQCSLSTVNNTRQDPQSALQVSFANSSAPFMQVPPIRVNVNTTTTIYLVINAVFSGSGGGYGYLYARRMR